MEVFKKNIDIVLIVLLGFILRFSISFTHSYSNDELSAINRLRFDNFSDLIEFGVMKGDMHPAGVQVFMKIWSSIAGTSELWMRLPFVLCGVLSVLALFFIGKKWFNRNTGLVAAGLLAVLYFPIMNSEFARPYSPGLLICILTAWYMHKVLICEVKKVKNAIILGCLFAAGMYTHYFAFMFLGFMGVTGLFLLNRENWKYYFIAGGLAILLFSPHIGVTDYHLNVGGLQWLGAPDKDWLFQFIFHAFNESWILIIAVLALIILSFVFRGEIQNSKRVYLILCLLWFFGIYIVGHVFSLISTPVLKFPVMLFALPFLLLLIGLVVSRFRYFKLALGVLVVAGLMSTTIEKDLYGNEHYGLFKELAEHITEWEEEVGAENTYTVFNLSNPNYMNYYANQWDKDIEFDWDVIEFSDDYAIRADLENRTESYCIVGYTARLTLVNVFETAKEVYPFIIDYHKYNNCAIFLLSKREEDQKVQQNYTREIELDCDKSERWNFNTDYCVKESGKSFYQLDSTNIYGPEFVFKPSGDYDLKGKYVQISFWAKGEEGAQLTTTVSATRNGEFVQHNGENFWIGHDVDAVMAKEEGNYCQYSTTVPDFIKADDELKFSFWNRNGAKIQLSNIQFRIVDNIWN